MQYRAKKVRRTVINGTAGSESVVIGYCQPPDPEKDLPGNQRMNDEKSGNLMNAL